MKNNISCGLKLLACSLSVFFVLLAVFDGFEEKKEIEYFGEFVSEAEFDFFELHESISRPTGNSKVKKTDRLPIKKFFDKVFNIFVSEKIFRVKPFFRFLKILSSYNLTITNSVCTNAP